MSKCLVGTSKLSRSGADSDLGHRSSSAERASWRRRALGRCAGALREAVEALEVLAESDYEETRFVAKNALMKLGYLKP